MSAHLSFLHTQSLHQSVHLIPTLQAKPAHDRGTCRAALQQAGMLHCPPGNRHIGKSYCMWLRTTGVYDAML